MVLAAALFAAPFLYLIVRNAASGSDFVATVFSTKAVGPLGRSLVLGISVTALSAVIGTVGAWLVTRTDVRLRTFWKVLLPLPLVIPSFIGAFVLIAAFAPGGLLEGILPISSGRLPRVRGFWGALVVLVLFTYPYVYLPAAARFSQLPASLEESARLLGRGGVNSFFTVVIPQVRTAIVAGGMLVFLYVISDFGVVQLMRYNALTRTIYASRLLDREVSLALALLLGIVAIAVVMLERRVARSFTAGAGKSGGPALQVRLGAWRAAATAFLAAVVTLALLVPVGVLLWWTLRSTTRGDAAGSHFLERLSALSGAALNTASVSVVAAVVAVVLVLPVAYLTVRGRSRVGELANAVVVGGFALPGLSIALALAFWALAAPGPAGRLYQSLALLVVAYVIHFGAQALRTAQVAVATIPRGVEDAARTLGAGRGRRLATVEVPIMTPGLLAGAGLVLLNSMKELPATLLLAPTGFQTLAVKIWTASEAALFADAALAALLLILVSAILTWLLVIRRSESLL